MEFRQNILPQILMESSNMAIKNMMANPASSPRFCTTSVRISFAPFFSSGSCKRDEMIPSPTNIDYEKVLNYSILYNAFNITYQVLRTT